jgi:hypothetical protein
LPPDYPAGLGREPEDAASGEGVHVGPGRYSLVNLEDAWELRTMLSIEHPGIEAQYRPGEGGAAIARLRHADGSWATAAGCPAGPARAAGRSAAAVGPGRRIEGPVAGRGSFPVYGAAAMIEGDGTVRLARGTWWATIA